MLTFFALLCGILLGWILRGKKDEITKAWKVRFGFGNPDD
jgi:hypothetical protein